MKKSKKTKKNRFSNQISNDAESQLRSVWDIPNANIIYRSFDLDPELVRRRFFIFLEMFIKSLQQE
jgi:hypothetical protein